MASCATVKSRKCILCQDYPTTSSKALSLSLALSPHFLNLFCFNRITGHAAGSFQGQRPTFLGWAQTWVRRASGTVFWTLPLTTVIDASMAWAIWADT